MDGLLEKGMKYVSVGIVEQHRRLGCNLEQMY